MAASDKDPTENVMKLVSAAVTRLDDLRAAEANRISNSLSDHFQRLHEQMVLRADFAERLAIAEAKRLDAIRAVDVGALSIANDKAIAQAATLANQVAATAATLRSLVDATAQAQAATLASITSQLTDRIGLLEKNQYEKKGSGTGMRDMYGWFFGGFMGLLSIAGFLYSILNK